MPRLLAAVLLLTATGCASRALWLGGHPPVLEQYLDDIVVRLYRAGLDCRVEIITKTATIITLPTRCLTVPHVQQP
jgi:hypothetical protein